MENLNNDQRIAAEKIQNWFLHDTIIKQVFVLSGYAGTGKTYLINFVIKNILNLEIKDIEYDKNIDEHNVEQIVAKILFDLTRNTGFEVYKGSIGDCWIKSCCDWKERAKDDICGLDYSKLSIYDKMKIIYEETCLKEQFSMAGLEVA